MSNEAYASSRWSALCEAVCDEPDDDGPRLLATAWLDEHDAPRAELVRTQCALAVTTGPGRYPLQQRERELLRAHAGRWCTVARGAVTFRRGFVEVLELAPGASVEAATRALALAPVRDVTVRGADDRAVDALCSAGAAWLGRLTSLRLYGSFGDASCAALATTAGLTQLTRLLVGGAGVGAPGVERLAKAPLLASVSTLGLSNCLVGDAGAAALAASPHLHGVQHLYLAQSELGDAGAAALVATESCTGLRLLGLAGNDALGDAGAEAIAASPYLLGLRALELNRCAVTARGYGAVLASETLRGLTRLDYDAMYTDRELDAALRARFGRGPR